MNYQIILAVLILAFLAYKAVRKASQIEIYARYRWKNSLRPTKSSRLASRFICLLMMLSTLPILGFSYAVFYFIMKICLTITYQTQGILDSDMRFEMIHPVVFIGLILCYKSMRKSAAKEFAEMESQTLNK